MELVPLVLTLALLGVPLGLCGAVLCPARGVQCRFEPRCLPPERRCDGVQDCRNWSEEDRCRACRPGASLCADASRCVADAYRCDGHPHCRDGSDEHGCAGRDPGPLWTCWSDNSTRSLTARCDGIVDCNGGEDETNCKACTRGAFKCSPLSDGRCRPAAWRCDGVDDCPNGTDEHFCPPPGPPGPTEPAPNKGTVRPVTPPPEPPQAASITTATSSKRSPTTTPGASVIPITSSTSNGDVHQDADNSTAAVSAELRHSGAALAAVYGVIFMAGVLVIGATMAGVLWIRRSRYSTREVGQGAGAAGDFSTMSAIVYSNRSEAENSYCEIEQVPLQSSGRSLPRLR